MKLVCPHCQGEFPLAAALEVQAGRAALAQALAMSGELGKLMARYLGMFRPLKRALSMDRAERLLQEIVPQIEGGIVIRRGAELQAPRDLWTAALRQMVQLADEGKLELPLKSHGYLLEIVAASASRTAGKREREVEQALMRGDRAKAAELRGEYHDRAARLLGDRQLKLITDEQYREQIAALKKEFGQ